MLLLTVAVPDITAPESERSSVHIGLVVLIPTLPVAVIRTFSVGVPVFLV